MTGGILHTGDGGSGDRRDTSYRTGLRPVNSARRNPLIGNILFSSGSRWGGGRPGESLESFGN